MSDELDVIEAINGLSVEAVDNAIAETNDRLQKLKALRKVVAAGVGSSRSGNSSSRSVPPEEREESDRAILDAAFVCCSRAEWEFAALREEIAGQLDSEVTVGKLRHLLSSDDRFTRNGKLWTAG